MVSAALAPGPGPRGAAAAGRRQAPPGSRGLVDRDRAARPARARRARRPRASFGNRHLTAAERARRAGGVGILAGIEGVAAAAAAAPARLPGPARSARATRSAAAGRSRAGPADNPAAGARPAADSLAADSPAAPAAGRAEPGAALRPRWAAQPEAGRPARGGAAPSWRSRSSSWRLRYCSSSFWPVSCRSWFSSRWIRISGSASSDCAWTAGSLAEDAPTEMLSVRTQSATDKPSIAAIAAAPAALRNLDDILP